MTEFRKEIQANVDVSEGPLACGHHCLVSVFPNQFRLIEFNEGYFFVDIPAVRARNVCLDCEDKHLKIHHTNEERIPSPRRNPHGEMQIEDSLGPMACGHYVKARVYPDRGRCIWFSPLEYCLDMPETRARWVCQDCRNQILGIQSESEETPTPKDQPGKLKFTASDLDELKASTLVRKRRSMPRRKKATS